MKSNCKICDKEFENKQKLQTCSVFCSEINKAKLSKINKNKFFRGNIKLHSLICPICKNRFNTARKKKYCSKECRNKFLNRYQYEKRLAKKNLVP